MIRSFGAASVAFTGLVIYFSKSIAFAFFPLGPSILSDRITTRFVGCWFSIQDFLFVFFPMFHSMTIGTYHDTLRNLFHYGVPRVATRNQVGYRSHLFIWVEVVVV